MAQEGLNPSKPLYVYVTRVLLLYYSVRSNTKPRKLPTYCWHHHGRCIGHHNYINIVSTHLWTHTKTRKRLYWESAGTTDAEKIPTTTAFSTRRQATEIIMVIRWRINRVIGIYNVNCMWSPNILYRGRWDHRPYDSRYLRDGNHDNYHVVGYWLLRLKKSGRRRPLYPRRLPFDFRRMRCVKVTCTSVTMS